MKNFLFKYILAALVAISGSLMAQESNMDHLHQRLLDMADAQEVTEVPKDLFVEVYFNDYDLEGDPSTWLIQMFDILSEASAMDLGDAGAWNLGLIYAGVADPSVDASMRLLVEDPKLALWLMSVPEVTMKDSVRVANSVEEVVTSVGESILTEEAALMMGPPERKRIAKKSCINLTNNNGTNNDDCITLTPDYGQYDHYSNDGNDTVTWTLPGFNRLYLGNGDDYADGYGTDSRYQVFILGEDGDDVAYGGNRKNLMNGGEGKDVMFGEDGDDYFNLNGGTNVGSEWFSGGRGNDTYDLWPGNYSGNTFTQITDDGGDVYLKGTPGNWTGPFLNTYNGGRHAEYRYNGTKRLIIWDGMAYSYYRGWVLKGSWCVRKTNQSACP